MNRSPRSQGRQSRPFLALALAPSLLLAAGCGDSAQDLYHKAEASYAREDYDRARIEVASALAKAPGDGAMLTLLARSYMRLGDPDGAQGAIHRLEEAGRSSAGLVALKAEIELARGHPKTALARLGDASSAEAWLVRAQANEALDRRNEAIAAYEKGMAAGGGIPLLEAYARFRLQANELDEAQAIYARMKALDPKAYATRVLAGDLAAALGQTDKAIATFEGVVADFPGAMAPRIALANQYDIKGEVDKAKQVADAAGKALGSTPALDALEIQLLSEKGEWKEITRRLQGRESQLDPGSALAMSYGEALLHLGHAEQGRLIFKRATLALPANPYARLMLGVAQIQTGDTKSAWETLRPLAMSPLARPEAIDAARQAAEAQGRPEAAQLAARLDPARLKPAQALIDRGESAMGAGKWAEAIAVYQPLLAQGEDVEVLKRLAMAEAHLGNGAAARDYADRALARDPQNPDCLYVAGYVRLQTGGDPVKARRLLEAAAKIDPRNTAIARELVKARAAAG